MSTISKANLGPDHLRVANAPPDTPIVGTDGGRAFTHGILSDQPGIDFADCRLDLLDAVRELLADHRGIGAIVLECTHMTPYAADLRKLTGVPVFSIYSFVRWFHQGVVPDRFPMEPDDPTLNLARRR